jgi:hypothetical protein
VYEGLETWLKSREGEEGVVNLLRLAFAQVECPVSGVRRRFLARFHSQLSTFSTFFSFLPRSFTRDKKADSTIPSIEL